MAGVATVCRPAIVLMVYGNVVTGPPTANVTGTFAVSVDVPAADIATKPRYTPGASEPGAAETVMASVPGPPGVAVVIPSQVPLAGVITEAVAVGLNGPLLPPLLTLMVDGPG